MGKILIAEDDAVTQKVISIVAQKLGHVAFVSPNGRHAFEAMKVNSFDLLITDIMMPEMDGKELIQRVRNDLGMKSFPIIIISAYVGVKEIASLLDSGATIFHPKPIDQEKLTHSLNKLMHA